MIHNNIKLAKYPEDLMRARYSAFVVMNGEFLIASHHSSNRGKVDKKDLLNWSKSIKWIKLDVIESTTNGDSGEVIFIAFYKQRFKTHQLKSKPTFLEIFCSVIIKNNKIFICILNLIESFRQ